MVPAGSDAPHQAVEYCPHHRRANLCSSANPLAPPASPLPLPTLHPLAFVHPLAVIIGDVSLGPHVSVWPTAVIRADSDAIEIGEDSNVQDGTIVHVDDGVPTRIGKRVAIGHRAIVHGATVEDDCLIAMGAILLNGVHVGTGSIVGAGAVCTEGLWIPPNSLVLGVPGKVIRKTSKAERDRISRTVQAYLVLQDAYRRGDHRTLL